MVIRRWRGSPASAPPLSHRHVSGHALAVRQGLASLEGWPCLGQRVRRNLPLRDPMDARCALPLGRVLRALHRERHASGNAVCIAVITSSAAPQTTRQEGKGATCSASPNFKRPFRMKTRADPATSRCQYWVSSRAGSMPTTTAALPCSTSAFAFAVHRERLRP